MRKNIIFKKPQQIQIPVEIFHSTDLAQSVWCVDFLIENCIITKIYF